MSGATYAFFPPHLPPSLCSLPPLSLPLLTLLLSLSSSLPPSLPRTHTIHCSIFSYYLILPTIYSVVFYAIFSVLWRILPTFVWTLVYYIILSDLFISVLLPLVQVVRLFFNSHR